VLLAFNFGEAAQTVDVPFPGGWRPMLETGASIEENRLTLPPFAFAALTLQ
jgi:hypothetical protein